MEELKENCIEWITGDKTVTATFTQKKFINRIRRMCETNGDRVEILSENQDGSILARFPLSAIHLAIYAPNSGSFKGVQDDGSN